MVFVCFFFDLYSDGCSKDTDCKGDRICEKGICVFPAEVPSGNNKAVFNQEDIELISAKKVERGFHLLRARKALHATIGSHIFSGILVGVGLAVYFYTDEKILSYIFFGIGGGMTLVTIGAFVGCLSHYGKAKRLRLEIESMGAVAFKNKYLTAYVPVPVIYKSGRNDLYGLSFNISF